MFLVTGATGYLGEQLVRHLVDMGERVRVLVRPPTKVRAVFGADIEQRLDVAQGDLGDSESKQRASNATRQNVLVNPVIVARCASS